MMRNWLGAAAAAAAVGLASLAQGQIATQAYAVTHFENWTFAPIVKNAEIEGFFCYADPTTLTGDNIPLVLYHRESDGTFSTWGWSSYDLGSAVMYIREAYAHDGIFEIDPVLSVAMTEESYAEAPKQMVEGLYYDDPAHLLLEATTDPAGLIETLVDIGWQVAPVLSTIAVGVVEPAPDCPDITVAPIDQLLMELSAGLEAAIFGAPATPVDCFLNSGCTGCITNYDPMTPKPNSGWIYRYTGRPSFTTDQLCYYDYPATQRWWMSGKRTDCSLCTGSGVDNTFIRGVRVVPAGQPCSPPGWTP